jgi:hypothetical protein
MEEKNNKGKSDIFSKAVRAGKRTYFFDVKSTKDDNLYLTVTESKRRFKNDGGYFYEKHKLFLYKEDFIKFTEGLNEVVEYIRQNNPTPVVEQTYNPSAEHHHEENDSYPSSSPEKISENGSFSDVDFDDLR